MQKQTQNTTKPNAQSGQVAVVVLLIMVVLLTIGLSLASRTTQEVFLSQQQSETARVFNAAESGVEEALSQDFASGQSEGSLVVDGVDVTYTVDTQNILDTLITEGMSAHIDLAGYAGNVVIDWAQEAACADRASFVATIFYDDAGTLRAQHISFGPPTTCVNHNDNFLQGSTLGGTPYFHRYTITAANLPANAQFMRLKPVYADADVLVSGGVGFPSQHNTIRSTASYSGGDEQRSIEVSRSLPAAPAFMDYALYSGGSITTP